MHTQILFLTSQFPIVKPRRKRKNPKKTILININSVRKKRATTKKKKTLYLLQSFASLSRIYSLSDISP